MVMPRGNKGRGEMRIRHVVLWHMRREVRRCVGDVWLGVIGQHGLNVVACDMWRAVCGWLVR